MSVSEEAALHVPEMRRYAHAMTGSQQSGDACVTATLERLVADPAAYAHSLSPRVALYKLMTGTCDFQALDNGRDALPTNPAELRLATLTPLLRQAFLLSSIEDFNLDAIAQILDLTPKQAQALTSQANRVLAKQVATNVLIIEDEPLIAMDLENAMEDIGHRVIGVARTQTEAIELARNHEVGLILSDIRLADGSSGIQAVKMLLQTISAPVIFVTAFPERLQFGWIASSYLITKPFKTSRVSAIANQALFFGENAHSSA